MLNKITEAEIREYMKNNPDTQAVEILLPDMCGILRGKRIGIESIDKLFGAGVMMPGSTYFLDATGRNCETLTIGVEEGDPDFPCLGASGSISSIPWNNSPVAQIIVDMYHHKGQNDGQSHFGNPRYLLSQIVDKFTEMGLTPVVALELEFYLLNRKLDKKGFPRGARLPGRTEPQTTTQVYGIEELYDFHEFLYDIEEAAEIQNLPVDTTTSEYAPSQYEVNLRHVADPILAADHAMLLKRLIKGVARKHNMLASFMAKPFAEQAGCGMHLHVSLVDNKTGRNVFAGSKDPISGLPIGDKLKHAIGGLSQSMAESMAIFAPNANSYRRLQSGSYAPINTVWGIDNRTVSLRVPHADEKSIRLEHRVAGADANPYLVTAAVLAGIHYGLTHQCDPGPPIQGNGYSQAEKTLPLRWWQAVDCFKKSSFIESYFSENYRNIYQLARSFESDQFNAHISPLDYEWYLTSV